MGRTLSILIAVLTMVLSVAAQENKTQAQTSTTSEIQKPKSEVDRMIEDAAKRGERIIGTCIGEDCPQESTAGGVQTGRILRMPKPNYPAIAYAAHAQGEVEVRVIINEEGMVIAAAAISGHPLLQSACVSAARDAEFAPTLIDGKPVKVTGVIKYEFRR